MKHRITRRGFLAGGAAAAAGTLLPMRRALGQPTKRAIILGFDGIEPSIVREMIAKGELPNLAKLESQGVFKELYSTIPPQSPVAWTSFTTSKNPGGHNIFDFIRRDPRGPQGPTPMVGTGKLIASEVDAEGKLTKPADAISYRKGDAFWKVADDQGLKCKVLNVPFCFPGDDMKQSRMLCGLGVPDLRGTTSTFTSLSDGFTSDQLKERLAGGKRIALAFDGSDVTEVDIEGPRDNRYEFRDPRAYAKTKLRIEADRKSGVCKVTVNGKSLDLTPGQWSDWMEFSYAFSPTYTVYAIARFYAQEIGQQVRIYMSTQQFHPQHPYVPFTEPADYAQELHDRYGLFKTIGWSYDTHALRQGGLDEDAFLADVEQTMAWRETLTVDEIDRGDFDLLISVWEAPDRVGHMFWRYRDPKHPLYVEGAPEKYARALENNYKIMDRIVGNVMGRLAADDLLMVISDHGFESWRTGFNANTWLRDQGFLTVNDPARAEAGFLGGIDWAKTQAYSIGVSSLYLNLKGRETGGIVEPDQAKNIIGQIRDKLLELKDEKTGDKIFTNVYTRDDYKGEAIDEAPDISFGFNRYYQLAKSSARGAVVEGWFEANDDKWSGEHAAADMAWCPGILFCNKAIEAPKPNILDISTTALKYLERDIPSDFEGVALV